MVVKLIFVSIATPCSACPDWCGVTVSVCVIALYLTVYDGLVCPRQPTDMLVCPLHCPQQLFTTMAFSSSALPTIVTRLSRTSRACCARGFSSDW